LVGFHPDGKLKPPWYEKYDALTRTNETDGIVYCTFTAGKAESLNFIRFIMPPPKQRAS